MKIALVVHLQKYPIHVSVERQLETYMLMAEARVHDQRKLTYFVKGSITAQLTSCLTVWIWPSKLICCSIIISKVVESNCTVILPLSMFSLPWALVTLLVATKFLKVSYYSMASIYSKVGWVVLLLIPECWISTTHFRTKYWRVQSANF